jgi:hypothetical protein
VAGKYLDQRVINHRDRSRHPVRVLIDCQYCHQGGISLKAASPTAMIATTRRSIPSVMRSRSIARVFCGLIRYARTDGFLENSVMPKLSGAAVGRAVSLGKP